MNLKHLAFLFIILFLFTFLTPSSADATPTLTIKDVSALPYAFSPNRDDIKDETIISATINISGFNRSSHPWWWRFSWLRRWFSRHLSLIWRLTIKDSQGRIIRIFIHRERIKDNSELKVSQVWDGRDLRGRIVADGRYTYRIDARLRQKRSHSLPEDIIVDNTPPQGTIIINNGNGYTNSQDVTLTLSAQDDLSGIEKMEFSNDKTNFSTPEGYSTSKPWTLTNGDGKKTVSVRFQDKAGNYSNIATDTIILDTTAPVVNITSPPDNKIFTTTPISVSGTINDNLDNNPLVTVNGKEATLSSGQFNIDNINLTSGTNTITARAEDIAKNTSFDSIVVIYDNTPPTTPIVTDDGEYTSSLTELHASWSSSDPETGIAEYQYSIGTTQSATDIVNWTSVGTDTEVTHTGLSLIQHQVYYFNVKAKNGAGLWSKIGSSDGIIAHSKTTLSIEIISPEDGALFNTSPITVEGIVSNSSATVMVNNISATLIDNTFSVSIPITEGTNTITAKATLESQTAQDQIDVILDLTPPGITILTPDEDATTQSNIIYGRVSEGTTSVTINGISAELIERDEYDTYFIAEPPDLTEGLNTITIEAEDKAANTTQMIHTFTYDTATPKVTITSPANHSTIDISPITVTGRVTSDISHIFIENSTGIIEDTNFTADYIRLSPIKSVITATAYDENNHKYQDAIIITTPDLKDYELTKVSGDIQEYEEGLPQAGSDWDLTIRLLINNQPALSQEIEFTITQGKGILSSQYVWTDIDGLATVTLTTDIDASITNKVEARPSSHPEIKTTFSVDTKPAQPANLIKITDETITPVPGATIPIIVKLTDAYNNAIQDEEIDFSITQGTGRLSANSATTNYYGEAYINFTAPATPETLTQIIATSYTNPTATTTFNITTSQTLTITIDDIITKVNANDEKIQDIKADITVTRKAPFLPPEMQLTIWQKGDKQKVEEIYPEPQ
ncbi:MAG: hypothetical protein DRH49_07280, partial [Candidatus Coatesbacteria bacterium]